MVEKWPAGLDDCLVRVPLVAAGPGIAEGRVCDGLVEMVDLLPTLCELAGTEPAHIHFGRSLVDALIGRTDSHRDAAFSEGGFRLDEEPQNELPADFPYDLKTTLVHERPELCSRAIAIRTPEWTYVRRNDDADELYDRTTDPAETTNIAGSEERADVIAGLRDRMLEWLVETSDVIPPARDPRMDPELSEGLW